MTVMCLSIQQSYKSNPIYTINPKVCEDVLMFVTRSRKMAVLKWNFTVMQLKH